MNFLKGTVAGSSAKGTAVLLGNGQTITVGRRSATARQGADVMLGIRPEDLQVAGDGDALLEGRVFAVERLGNETYAYLDVPGSSDFAAHAAGDIEIQAGDDMKVGLIAGKCHLFDGDGRAFETV